MIRNEGSYLMVVRLALLLPLLLLASGTGCQGAIDTGLQGSDGGMGHLDGGAVADLGPSCTSNADCKGGYCVNGRCCPSKDKVCGGKCCGPHQICFANACVNPGIPCFSSGECPKGWYCEPSLGPDGGVKDAGPAPDGKVCLKPRPRKGRCLKLPSKCNNSAGKDAGVSTDGCLPPCEYKPKTGKLQVSQRWAWGPKAAAHPTYIDVWSTPTVGRVHDTNCDGRVTDLDPPAVVLVTGNVKSTCCHCSGSNMCRRGVLRAIDGETGKELWSLRQAYAKSIGFSGISPALGARLGKTAHSQEPPDIFAVTGEGKVVKVSGAGKVLAVSDKALSGYTAAAFGWGGGLALADMDADGHIEVAFGATVFTTSGGGLKRVFEGTGGIGGGSVYRALSTFADLDGAADGKLELVAGNTVYKADGTQLWRRKDLADGFPGVADLDRDGKPEVVLVSKGKVYVLRGVDGKTLAGPTALGSSGLGGPPTIADFNGDKAPEIGVAQAKFYFMLKPDLAKGKLAEVWRAPNHDLSSSVTGSTVFDFEGDGSAEVIYNDECFLWVYDGKTGKVRFATPTTSFTGTETALVADVDGDGKAEMLQIANGASPTKWKCNVAPWNKPDPKVGRPAWKPPAGGSAYRGLMLWEGKANTWVGTRTLWNQHTYHVSNICDNRDTACAMPNHYGLVPQKERPNWKVKWLNNFRQNVQDKGLFDAPDPIVTLKADCTSPVVLHAYLRNFGLALMPAGVEVGYYVRDAGADRLLGKAKTTIPLYPGQVQELTYTAKKADKVTVTDTFRARVLMDPTNPLFHECRPGNNVSLAATPHCLY